MGDRYETLPVLRVSEVFVLSRLDYCNAVMLAGLPKKTIAPLQRVQHAAAQLIAGLVRVIT